MKTRKANAHRFGRPRVGAGFNLLELCAAAPKPTLWTNAVQGQRAFKTCAAALCWLVAAAATADTLVMNDGACLETQGPWTVKGAIVVFTLPNGTLSSVRVREVDLDRSAEATAAARLEAERTTGESEPPPPKAVYEITSETVSRASPEILAAEAASAAGEAAEGEAAEGEADEGQHRLLEVLTWRQAERPDGGSEILGELRNKTDSTVGQIAVRVLIYGGGEILSQGYAFLDSPVLGRRGTTSFRMPLEDVYALDDVRFRLEGMEILLRPTDAPTGAGDTAEDEEGQP
jgi:hypothetical protein